MDLLDLLDLSQSVIDGVLFGTTYSLIGIGFTLIFGVMHKINLSYAAASIGAAYLSLIVVTAVPTPLVYASAAVMGGVLGWLIYLICFRFIPLNNPLATLMSTVGMLLAIEELISHLTYGMPQNYPALFASSNFEIGQFFLRGDLIFVFGLGCVAMVLLMQLLKRTRLGLATRAVAQQPVAAQLCGMSVNNTNASTFIIAGLLGGTAGAMAGAAIGVLSPLMTLPLTVKGLVVTVIGGLGSIEGAAIGALIVGLARAASVHIWPPAELFSIYVVMAAILVFKPEGLFQRTQARKI